MTTTTRIQFKLTHDGRAMCINGHAAEYKYEQLEEAGITGVVFSDGLPTVENNLAALAAAYEQAKAESERISDEREAGIEHSRDEVLDARKNRQACSDSLTTEIDRVLAALKAHTPDHQAAIAADRRRIEYTAESIRKSGKLMVSRYDGRDVYGQTFKAGTQIYYSKDGCVVA